MDTSCHLDGTLFPFDSQACSIIIESWSYSEDYLDLRNASNYMHLDGFNDNGQPIKNFVHGATKTGALLCRPLFTIFLF